MVVIAGVSDGFGRRLFQNRGGSVSPVGAGRLRRCADSITAYVSVASKAASFALLLRLFLSVFWPVRMNGRRC